MASGARGLGSGLQRRVANLFCDPGIIGIRFHISLLNKTQNAPLRPLLHFK
jgi:hypothetical protein